MAEGFIFVVARLDGYGGPFALLSLPPSLGPPLPLSHTHILSPSSTVGKIDASPSVPSFQLSLSLTVSFLLSFTSSFPLPLLPSFRPSFSPSFPHPPPAYSSYRFYPSISIKEGAALQVLGKFRAKSDAIVVCQQVGR